MGPGVRRRGFLGLMGAAGAVGAARGEPWLRRYVVIYCDSTLKPVMRAVGDGFGPPVTVFAGPPAVSLGLLAHAAQNDLLITTEAPARAAFDGNLLADGTLPAPLWRNRLVVAGARGAAAVAGLDAVGVKALLGETGKFALTDATQAATIDGPAVMGAMGLSEGLRGRIVGAASTDEIGFLIRTGAAKLGLCHRTDVRADPALAELCEVPEASYPPIRYCVCRTKKAWSANIEAFDKYLAAPGTVAMLGRLGLDAA
jgi:hypothetical protein